MRLKLKKKALLLFIGFSLFYFEGLSQENTSNKIFIEPELQIGKIVKNYPYPIFPRNVGVAIFPGLHLGYATGGSKKWHHEYGFPMIGVNLIYGVLGNDSVIGRNISLMPDITFSTRKYTGDNWGFDFRIGTGLSWFNKKYDSVNNRGNYLIGSRLNSFSNASFCFRYKINEYLYWKAGIATLHFSNTHFQLPNIGVNTLQFHTSLRYFPQGLSEYPKRKIPEKANAPILVNVRAGFGMHEFGSELGPIGKKKYNIYATSVYLSKRIGMVSSVHAGFMMKYYTNYEEYIQNHNLYPNQNRIIKSSSFNFFLGHEFLCGHFSMLTQGGVNFYNPFYWYYDPIVHPRRNAFTFTETWFCGRLGAQYYFFEPEKKRRTNFYVGTYINSLFSRADFAEVSCGISF
ncbi:MAG: acyloxyacyl hydrolase [Bacteroidetes bacterium]|nr:acyloxyacyl hydrolase [Bacteroidota bacterium]